MVLREANRVKNKQVYSQVELIMWEENLQQQILLLVKYSIFISNLFRLWCLQIRYCMYNEVDRY
ncbi:hypothetical protein GLYMA_16G104800v4 [Glycine max]|nr:hypothetical protein GLYMA_16G104800v4 [Glycine max]KAH1150854.1 hypothetical protein GYH30_044728 [Glycine max]